MIENNDYSSISDFRIRCFTTSFITGKYLFQNIEKKKRASELAIANEELLFQNDEKGKRAAELAIANQNPVFAAML